MVSYKVTRRNKTSERGGEREGKQRAQQMQKPASETLVAII
jgi:hypothetical protein